ncbi:putative repeat protein (TIGR01451 family) [Streptosporangium becharense]|uniref:Putative repeat protein (TIGR01451 family) n=1 Tax=Streptosporangium becharense TaxID=1816182 RepID=A0A7W9IFA8_9ACTN|nr:DUF11 domain-containing protein [Streptosporangium becharense]MBB2909578.1 putative repeat protein (TIGR01451 family) [Streptosporangium becharense]MBB5819466.1 putative repeat protein (TIGR01451 family) [Streptosporangium becharense]
MVGGSVGKGHGVVRVVAGVVSLVLAAVPGPVLAGQALGVPLSAGQTLAGPLPAGRGGEDRGAADLSVRLSASPPVAQPGQPLIYRAQVRNAGPGDAVLPTLTVRLPDGVRVLGVDVAECGPGEAANEVVCASTKDVLAGETGGVTINGLVGPEAHGPLRATATLSSEVVDGNEADNSAQVSTRLDEGTDLAVRLSRRARAGRMVTMAAVVRNRGPKRVRDALLFFDTGGARFLRAEGARCDPLPGSLGCELRAVGPGERVSLRLAFVTRKRGPRAEATVYSARLGDRHPANNTARLRLG